MYSDDNIYKFRTYQEKKIQHTTKYTVDEFMNIHKYEQGVKSKHVRETNILMYN